jgi:hypothetical protein
MESKSREFRDRKIYLTSEIEGGNAYNFKKFPGNIYGFTPKRDPGEGYSGQAYYFKFQIENLCKDPTNVTITAIADYDDTWKGWQSSINPTIWIFSPNRQKNPIQLSPDLVRATTQSMSITISLQSYEKIILSNMFTPSYTGLVQIVEDLASQYPTFLQLKEIGRSPMDNPIYTIKVNPEAESYDIFKILVGGTSQPNEFGDYSSILILQQFLTMGADFWDEFSAKFSLEFLLFQNPDGMKLGTNMVNSKGENPFFSWHSDPKTMPDENQIVWNYIIDNPPNFYLEMHSFFQDRKTIRPYIYPIELLQNKRDQKLYQKVSKTLIKYCNGIQEQIHINQPYFQNTLCYRLMEQYHTLALQFKLHSGMSVSEITQTSWKVFGSIYKSLIRGI